MIAATPRFKCHGCGATVDMAHRPPYACPNIAIDDDIDHLLVAQNGDDRLALGLEADPFLRYRTLLSPYRLARSAGLSDEAWAEIVGRLDRALIAIDGHGFRITPMVPQEALAKAAGFDGVLWVKDETANVSGSHKARHLMGVMLYLRVLEIARLAAGEGMRTRRLAIASCGNAALAAAVIARATDWPLDVFIPPDAPRSVVQRLRELGATIHVCARVPGETGDPCVKAFRRAVDASSIPFGVQGPANGLAVEGGRTLAFEMAEQFGVAGVEPAALFVQVGGGALVSALAQGFAVAAGQGTIARPPRLMLVQTAGCAPLLRAWQRMSGIELGDAVRHRSRFMWPWENVASSLAQGIVDDETYDWWEAAKGMRNTGGRPLAADEASLGRANALARACTGINVSATGSAGLAGLLAAGEQNSQAALIFSGAER
jgi:threonine synthase